ncbi:hypothetical protein [Bacillus sp. PS06]|uniref:hypothetical protein n=1 Tax=Bacillus sp. PS06 TaxID=2764176 RepID=UPI00177DB4E2|nr:hypothetical protein [Bacillus sp. PS06]MBD8068165.1 hypothetical protein [Bacillus sp. PS06]
MNYPIYNNEFDSTRNLHDKCKTYMYHHALLTMNDGNTFDGIIEKVDNNNITVLVGEDVFDIEMDEVDARYGFGYGPRRRFRRFGRRTFPLAALATLALLPYVYPPYPYYPYY